MRTKVVFKSLVYAMQGAIVGIGAILPGVSGGVLSVAFGIYEPMMELLTHPKKSFGKYYKMFIPFIIGWMIGFIFLAKSVQLLFDFSPEIALMLFFGLICGTIPELFKTSEKAILQKAGRRLCCLLLWRICCFICWKTESQQRLLLRLSVILWPAQFGD